MVDKIKGGLADSKTLDDIAEKHGVTLSAIESALADGIKVESEHTTDVKVAEEIAKDHLFEDAKYYSKLSAIEKQNEAGTWITVKPHEDSKGTHVFIKEGQTAKEAIDDKFDKSEDKQPTTKESKKENIGTYIDERGKTKSLKNVKSIIDYMDWQDDSINFAKGIEGEGKVKGENYVIFAPYKATKLGGLSREQIDGIKQNYLRKITSVLKGKSSYIQERGDGTFAIMYDENKIKEALFKKEKTNSKDWAKTYKASNFIEKGVCTYNDETIYLSQEALNKAILSIKGRPVVIKHQKVTPQNMEDHAVGYVSDCGFCDQEASFYCNFLVFDDEGKEVIAKDYSVSCAYIPKAFGIGGTWHNTPYDREVTELEFTHLALVPDPRYEDAKIYENSKDNDNKKKETYDMEKIEVEQGFLASLIELAQKPFLNSKKEEEPKEKEDAKVDDDEMEYEGKKYSKKELVNAFEAGCAGKKAEEEKEMKNAIEAEEAAKAEADRLAEEEKLNAKDSDDDMEFFNSMQALMATASQDADDKVEVHSQNKGLELGSKAFG